MTLEFSAVFLVDYAALIGYTECAFFGVNHPNNADYECRAIWTKAQRDMVAFALAEAQEEIEQDIRYHLTPRWITGERHEYRPVILAEWGYVIAGGVISDVMIQAGAAVNHATDPATVTVPGVTCAAASIHIFHAGTDTEIIPSALSVSALGVLTASIPWCRLVAPAYEDNPPEGLVYADHATWIAGTVDVRCITNDTSTQATLIVPPSACCTTTPCTDTEYSACIHLRRPKLGSLSVRRATYSGGAWTGASFCYEPAWVELNYYAGLQTLTKQARDTIIRLAHSKMPDEPCGCDVTQRLWKRDRNVPQVLTRERINCPFGMSDGAWTAWRFAQTMRLVRGGEPL